jgi:glycosyltransferase involved in cell wall biosynthesis
MRVLNGIMFFPRGGSAYVARSLSRALTENGWAVRILSGSLPGGPGHADTFYADLDVHVVDFTTGEAPMQPSYEDHPGTADRCFALIDDGAPAHWNHAVAWARRMRRWARQCTRIVVQTPGNIDRAVALLGVDPTDCDVVANGFDATLFAPRPVDRDGIWRRALVDEPRGWRPREAPGSVAYAAEQVTVLEEAVILVAVGRYTAVKRLGLLIEAFARAERRARRIPALVIIGGYPGEYEGEHPWDAVQRTGARNVFLAGWHDHSVLPDFLNAADAQVLASVREQFGLVLVEGMACGLPALAVNRLGPAEIVEDGRTGWLIDPDDRDQLTAAIVSVLDDDDERLRRGHHARITATDRWGWPALSARLIRTLTVAQQTAPVRAAG